MFVGGNSLFSNRVAGQWLRAAALVLCSFIPACRHGSTTPEPIAAVTPSLPAETPQLEPAKDLTAQTPPLPFQPIPTAADASVAAEKVVALPQRQPPILVLDAATSTRVDPVGYTPQRAGLVSALEHYMERRNDEAVAALRRYPAEDREIALITLPILANIDQGETWSAITAPQRLAILESIRTLQRRLARSAPLVLQKVVFLDHVQSPAFGEIKPRVSNQFRPEDWVCIYFETLNLVDAPLENQLYSAKINTAITLCSQDGNVVWADTCVFQKAPSISPRTDFCFTASLTLPPQAPPGAYQLQLTVTDMDTGRQAKQSLPLQIVQRAARKPKN